MNISKAKKLLSIDISKMSLEALQKQYVSLLDAWRYAKGDYGHDNTFFAYCGEMRGFVPADYWLERNLATRLSEIEKILSKRYSETAFRPSAGDDLPALTMAGQYIRKE